MVSNYYCQDCDKNNNRKIKQHHKKSKAQLNMYYIIITNKYNICDVFWSDFEKTIYEYMNENRTKFYTFSILVRCKQDNEDISISADANEVDVPLYRFDDCGWVCYTYCKSKKNTRLYISSCYGEGY